MENPIWTRKFQQAITSALDIEDPTKRAKTEAVVKAAKEEWGKRARFISVHSFVYQKLRAEGLIDEVT